MSETKNARALWKGTLSFGLVTIPVRILAAVRDFVSPLHQYHKDNLLPIRHLKFAGDYQRGAVPVEFNQIVRGLEVETDAGKKVVALSDEELANLNIESEKVIDIDCFVDANEIDARHFEKPYFLEADKGGQKGYSLLFNVLKKSNKVGIAKVALRGREYLMAVGAHSKFNLLVLETLRWTHEMVEPMCAAANADVSKDELQLAQMLVDSRTATFNPEKYKDNYFAGLNALIQEKSTTGKVTKRTKKELPKPNAAPDMLAILRESIKVAPKGDAPKAKGKKMLMT